MAKESSVSSGGAAGFWPRDEWLDPLTADGLEGVGAELDDADFRDDAEGMGDACLLELGIAPLSRRALLIHRFKELWAQLQSSFATPASSEPRERFTDEQWRELADTALFASSLGLAPLSKPSEVTRAGEGYQGAADALDKTRIKRHSSAGSKLNTLDDDGSRK